MSRCSKAGGRRRAGFVVALIVVLAAGPVQAQAQQATSQGAHVLRAGIVGFGTGAELNCRNGSGVSAGVEVRTGGRWFAGVGADLYVATPAVCTDVGTIVPHESGTVHEFSGITLLFAPRLSGRVGTTFGLAAVRVEPSLGAGAVYAPAMWGDAGRSVVPWAGAALAVQPRGWRVGFALEHGYHRVPVSHQMSGAAGWQVVDEFGRWKPVTNVAIRLRR